MENRIVVTISGEDYTFVAEESPAYMGLPVLRLSRMLAKFGISLLD